MNPPLPASPLQLDDAQYRRLRNTFDRTKASGPNLTQLIIALFSLCTAYSAWAASQDADCHDLTLPEIKKYITSPQTKKREWAMFQITATDGGGIYENASPHELADLLLKGLSDRVPLVRLRAVEAAYSQAKRLGDSPDSPQIEKKLLNLFSTDPQIVDDDGTPTKIHIEALAALQQFKYYQLPPDVYSTWEDQNLIFTVEGLDDAGEGYDAARLCFNIQNGHNEKILTRILRHALQSKSEQVRLSGLNTLAGFGSENWVLYRPSLLFVYVSLSPDVRRIESSDDSSKCRNYAKDIIREFDGYVEEYEKEMGIKLEPH